MSKTVSEWISCCMRKHGPKGDKTMTHDQCVAAAMKKFGKSKDFIRKIISDMEEDIIKIPLDHIVFLESNVWRSTIEAKKWRSAEKDERELLKGVVLRVKDWRYDEKYYKKTGEYFVYDVTFEIQDGNHRFLEFLSRIKDREGSYITSKDVKIVKKSATEEAWIAIEEFLEEHVFKHN